MIDEETEQPGVSSASGSVDQNARRAYILSEHKLIEPDPESGSEAPAPSDSGGVPTQSSSKTELAELARLEDGGHDESQRDRPQLPSAPSTARDHDYEPWPEQPRIADSLLIIVVCSGIAAALLILYGLFHGLPGLSL